MKVVSLKKRSEFKLLFKEGKRVYQDHFNVVYLFNRNGVGVETMGYLKIAYVVSKKVSGKAVVRNRIKRRLRAAVRLVLKEKELKGNASLLIAIRPSDKIIEASFQQICLEVKKSFDQLLR